MPARSAGQGLGHGDRALYQGIGRCCGKHCDVLAVRRDVTAVRFDQAGALLVRSADLHPIPRRPPPMF